MLGFWIGGPVRLCLLCSCLGCGRTDDRASPIGPITNELDSTTAGSDALGAEAVAPSAPAREGKLQTKNSAGRTGSYYLPAGYNTKPMPLLLGYHGTGGEGSNMVAAFHQKAASLQFIIVAPDSRVHPQYGYTWEVADKPGEVTEDYTHALNCLAEVEAMSGVAVDPLLVIAAGFSGGGSSAPYLSSNENRFRAFAVLHGGVIQGGIGSNIIPGWFSTGAADEMRPPELVQKSVDYMKGLGFTDVVFRTFEEAHEMNTEEINSLVVWWLGAT